MIMPTPDIISRMPLGYIQWDAHFRVAAWNAFAERIFGWTGQEAAGRSGYDLMIPAGKRTFFDQAWVQMRSGEPNRLVLDTVAKEGSNLTTEWFNTPILNDRGLFTGVVSVINDISEKSRLEVELRESRRYLQTIIESEPECVKLVAADGSLVMMNRAGLDMIQADSLEQIRGRSVYPLVDPAFLEPFQQSIREAFSGRSSRLQFIMIGLKGRRLWMDSHAVPLRNDRDEVVGMLAITRDISIARDTEDVLKKERDFIAAVLDTVGSIVLVLDRDGKIVRFNRQCEAVSGYTFNEVAGRYVWDFLIPPEQVPGVRRVFANLQAGMFPNKHENFWVARDGSRRLIAWSNTALVNQRGEVEFVIPTGIDITDRKRGEEALRVSEERFRSLFDLATDGILLLEPASAGGPPVIVDINAAACAMNGYDHDELIGRPITILTADKARIPEMVSRLMSGEPATFEIEHIRKDGARYPLEVSARLIRINDKPYFISIERDMSDRRQKERFIRDILENVDESFIVLDRNFTIQSANRAYCAQAGLPPESVIGRPCYQVSHHINKPCYEAGERCPVRETFDTGLPSTFVHTHFAPDGKVTYMETKSFPMRDGSGRVSAVIEILNDITEKRKLEEQLRHAQKMESVGTLAGGIAHDFNNILTAIIGYGNLLSMKTRGDERLGHHVEQILASANRAAQLTRGLLAYSRKQIINPQSVDVNEVIRRVQKLLSRILGEDIAFSSRLATVPAVVHADPGQLEQVLMNLATNARDAMHDGGLLLIETKLIELDEEFTRSHAYGKPGPHVVISVTDSGTGMSEDLREKIFEPFFTTKEVGKGTGLGLAIVYGIVTQHNGYINVYSEVGKGTTFNIYLPAVTAYPGERPVPFEDQVPQGGTETILLAEDDEMIRTLIAEMLGSFGYTVITAQDGNEALARFRENSDRISLLLLDVIIPGKNGKEIHDEIRRLKPEIKAVFLSGYTADLISKKGILEEGVNFLQKPITLQSLLSKVRAVLSPP